MIGRNTAIGYYNGNIYLASGFDGAQVQTTTWSFDPSTGLYTNLAAIPIGVSGSAGGIFDGHFIVAGGKDATNIATKKVWDFNIATNTWTAKSDMLAAVDFPGSASYREFLEEELFLVFGGGTAADPFANSRTTQIYDPVHDIWTPGPNLNVGRYAPAGTAVRNSG